MQHRYSNRMDMKGILERIDKRIAERDTSAAAVSKAATGSPDTIRNWQRNLKDGKDAGATLTKVAQVANVLGFSMWELISGEEKDERIVDVPLVSWVSAGNLRPNEGVQPDQIEKHVPVANLPKGDWLALKVLGDSMDRVAPEDSILIVNRADETLIDGKFYVFSLEGGEATFKRFRRRPEMMLQPYSTNLDHLSISVRDKELYVFGRVRRVISDV